MKSRFWIPAAIMMLSSLLGFASTDVPGPSFEEVLSLRTVSSPALSPDGTQVAFEVRTVDWRENRYDTEIWLSKNHDVPFQLTRNDSGDSHSPRWSPDGEWIAFLSDRGEKEQIFLIRPDGGEAQGITSFEEGIQDFRWSPDGKRMAFTAQEPKSEALKAREERYGEFTVEDQDYRQSHLWVVDLVPDPWPAPVERPCPDSAETKVEADAEKDCLSAPEAERLTEGGSFTVVSFAWSPDGRRMALQVQSDPLITSYVTGDIHLLDLESKSMTALVETPGYDGRPVWSPDGKWIAYPSAGGDETSDFYRNRKIFRVSVEGGTPTWIGSDINEDLGTPLWTKTGLYSLAWQKSETRLFRLHAGGGPSEIVTTEPRNIWDFDFDDSGEVLALYGQNRGSLGEIFLASLEDLQPSQATEMTQQIGGWALGSAEMMEWESRDGTKIEGVLHKPPHFDPGQKYPLLVVIHGGPTGIDYPTAVVQSVYPIPQWLAGGALVLRPNYRGSAGYGEEFRSLNVRNLGIGDMWDVMSGVDHLIEQGYVDSDRMGAMGWSQGGYISAFLTTNTDRFQAISVGAGISDWETYYVSTDIHPFTRQYLKATPWEDPEIYAETSPITHIRQASTPTLIQHGELDRRVPISNAYKLFQGLQDMGVPTRLIVYEGFGHGIRKPKERLAALWQNYQWFARYLWGEEVELPLGLGEEKEK